ncbi:MULTISPECIES: DUF732 domain-containing protein [Rhodococcus]|uniref:DUF732 domain-containing protein n=1 Tax=Rhodococcus TaxID=1827 RepID=UPI000C7B94E0|nr:MULTISPECIES: DUF732 domain-containing protein [Rhodococcus]AUM18256.1 hypothetical protein CSW53_18030 [Rhodococcus ruber]
MTSATRGNLKALAYCAILIGVLVAIWGVPKLLKQDDEPVVVAETAETTTAAAPTTTVRRPVTIPTTNRPTLGADDRYILQLDPQVRASNSRTDLINLGHNICGELDTGSTKADVTRILVDSGFLLSQSMDIIDAAETAYCP